jgi:hypothetical protein
LQRGNGNGALGQQKQGHWGNGNGGQRRSIDHRNVYVVLQHKTSTIVVDETVQNVWTADIPAFCAGIKHA